MSHTDNPIEILKEIGVRATPQRNAVLGVLTREGRPLTAREIYEQVSEQETHLSLQTVYRTLAALQDAGLVASGRLRSHRAQTYFEYRGGTPSTTFTCLECGKRLAVPARHITQLGRELAAEQGLAVTEGYTMLAGYCRGCLEKLGREEKSEMVESLLSAC